MTDTQMGRPDGVVQGGRARRVQALPSWAGLRARVPRQRPPQEQPLLPSDPELPSPATGPLLVIGGALVTVTLALAAAMSLGAVASLW
jgi:hypothetical protein